MSNLFTPAKKPRGKPKAAPPFSKAFTEPRPVPVRPPPPPTPPYSPPVKSERFNAFMADLRALCMKHKITLIADGGHAGIEIVPFDESHMRNLEDSCDETEVKP